MFNCNLCEKKFKLKGTLKKHLANIHDIDVKWHYCDLCEKKFKHKSQLKTHLVPRKIVVGWNTGGHTSINFPLKPMSNHRFLRNILVSTDENLQINSTKKSQCKTKRGC